MAPIRSASGPGAGEAGGGGGRILPRVAAPRSWRERRGVGPTGKLGVREVDRLDSQGEGMSPDGDLPMRPRLSEGSRQWGDVDKARLEAVYLVMPRRANESGTRPGLARVRSAMGTRCRRRGAVGSCPEPQPLGAVAGAAWDRASHKPGAAAQPAGWTTRSKRGWTPVDPLDDLLLDQSGISTHVDGCQLATGPAAVPDSIVTASPSGSARNLSVMRPASVKSSAS